MSATSAWPKGDDMCDLLVNGHLGDDLIPLVDMYEYAIQHGEFEMVKINDVRRQSREPEPHLIRLMNLLDMILGEPEVCQRLSEAVRTRLREHLQKLYDLDPETDDLPESSQISLNKRSKMAKVLSLVRESMAEAEPAVGQELRREGQ